MEYELMLKNSNIFPRSKLGPQVHVTITLKRTTEGLIGLLI